MMKDFDKVLSSGMLLDATFIGPFHKRLTSATEDSVRVAVAAYRDPQPQIVGDIAVINCSGPITHRCSPFSMWYGSSTIEGMQQQFRMALQDPSVKTIVFRVESPGGVIDMVPEFADEIFQARDIKPTIAVADTMIASAATWLFTGAASVVVPRSGSIGSIGVYLMHSDYSKMLDDVGIKVTFIYAGEHKIDGNSYAALSDDAKAQFQDEVDEIFKDFNGAVARNRGVTTKQVLESFGQGRMFRGQKAVKLGLADKMSTFDAVIGRLQGTKKRSSVSVDALAPEPNAEIMDPATPPPPAAATTDGSDGIEPEDGKCADGYELDDDGLCYPIEQGAKAGEPATADDDEEALVAASRIYGR